MKKFLTPPMRAVKGSFRGLILGSLMLGATASFAQDKITTTPKHDAQTVKFRGHNAIQGVVRVKFKNAYESQNKLALSRSIFFKKDLLYLPCHLA